MKLEPLKQDEKGLTLVEVVASIVLLMILLTFFMNFLNQSAKMNQISKQTVDATHIAQTEMENILSESKNFQLDDRKKALRKYHKVGEEAGWEVWKRYTENESEWADFNITLKLTEEGSSPYLTKLIIEVENKQDENSYAMMQHVLTWKEVSNEKK